MKDSLVLIKYIDGVYNTLEDNSLKVSTPNSINDPFELMIQEPEIYSRDQVKEYLSNLKKEGYNLIDMDLELIVDKFITNAHKESLFKKMTMNMKNAVDFNFISFSSKRANPTQDYFMWSLYGSKPGNPHCGVRLHFDSESLIKNKKNFKLERIIYSKERLKLNNPFQAQSPESLEMFRQLLLTKSDIWSHECEYRLIIKPRLNDVWERDGKEFLHFPTRSLKKIIFGFNFEDAKIEDVIISLSSDKRYGHVKLFKTELHPRKFELKYIRV